MMREAEKRGKALEQRVRQLEAAIADRLAADPVVVSVRGRGDGVESEHYSHPGVVARLTTAGGGSSRQLMFYADGGGPLDDDEVLDDQIGVKD